MAPGTISWLADSIMCPGTAVHKYSRREEDTLAQLAGGTSVPAGPRPSPWGQNVHIRDDNGIIQYITVRVGRRGESISR